MARKQITERQSQMDTSGSSVAKFLISHLSEKDLLDLAVRINDDVAWLDEFADEIEEKAKHDLYKLGLLSPVGHDTVSCPACSKKIDPSAYADPEGLADADNDDDED